MKKAMYKRYENIKPIGTQAFTNNFGIAIFEPDEHDKYNCDFVAAWSTCDYMYGYHRHKIYFTNTERAYIRKGGIRIYLDEVMRCI